LLTLLNYERLVDTNHIHISPTLINFSQISRSQTFSNIIHLRDFVDAVLDDPTKDSGSNHVEIRTDANICAEDGFCESGIVVEPIRTRIRAYLPRDERQSYVTDSFFYADGRFSTALSADNVLEINVQSLSLMW
jgi:hypothetical protein